MVEQEYELIQIHLENLRRETSLRQALSQSGLIKPSILDRVSSILGDALIRVGTRLKQHAYTRLTTEEASNPAFLIML